MFVVYLIAINDVLNPSDRLRLSESCSGLLSTTVDVLSASVKASASHF